MTIYRTCPLIVPDLNDWPRKELPRPDSVVQYAEAEDETRDQDTIIHGSSSSRRVCRPEAEKKEDHQVSTCEYVVRDAEDTRHVPRTPDNLCILDWQLRVLDPYGFNAACDTAVEEKATDYKIGSVEAADDQRYNIVKSCRGANVDENKEARIDC